MTYFSLTWMSFESRVPPNDSPQPPSFRQSSASISSRLFLSSHSTPLYGPPPSSSAVSATMMSRSGLKPFALVANQVRDPDRRLRLVVAGAAAVEVAVLLDERERVHAPVFALRFDDVGVREQENGSTPSGAAVANDEIRLGGTRAADEDVRLGESGCLEPPGDGLGDGRRRAGREAGLDLDHLLVDLARQLSFGFRRVHGATLSAHEYGSRPQQERG